MATYTQIVIARAAETQGVWALAPAFTGGGRDKGTHASQISAAIFARTAKDTAAGAVAAANSVMRVEHNFFKEMNVPIAQRLDSEVPDTEELQKRVDEADNLKPSSEANIERRTELSITIWKEVNAARAATVPPPGPVVVRGTTVEQYETRYTALLAKRIQRDEKDGVLTAKRAAEKRETRKLDLWNKSWYQAWKSEFPPDTDNGAALSNVHTEEGTPPPQPLVMLPVTQIFY